MRNSTWIVLGFAAFALAAARAAAQDEDLVYRRGATRQATYEAALRESGLPAFGPWAQAAPFDPLLRRKQEPDDNAAADATYQLYGGGSASWQPQPDYLDGYANTLDLSALGAKTLDKKPTLYLRRTIWAPAAGTIRVFLGCDAAFKLALNGKERFYAGAVEDFDPGGEVAELPLAEGENVLLLKIGLTKNPCRFFFLPDLGAPRTEELLARLHADFPAQGLPLTGYRERSQLKSTSAEDRYYRLVEIEPPPGVVIEGTGLGCTRDGRLAVATRRGFVYLVENPGSALAADIRFHRFAAGLHEPLGLGVHGDKLLVVNRGEVTRLVDADGDGLADRFECLANGWGLTGNYHEYAYGLPADRPGNLYVALNLTFGKGGPSADAPYRGCVVRITPAGKLEPVCCGLRSPNGIGRNNEGDIFVTDNQGDWVPACPLYHVEPGSYFGHPASAPWYSSLVGAKPLGEGKLPPRTLPAVWFPYEELCQSATDIVCDTSAGQFGPFAGQLFVGEMTKGLVVRVQLERVNGRYQGTCFLFRRGCGAANRLAFGPDGKLYLARVNRGWGGGGLGEGLARLEFTGRLPLEVHSVRLLSDGFELRFTKPLDEGEGAAPADYKLEQYTYHHWQTYGSPKINLAPVAVTAVAVAEDRRSVRLTARGLAAGKVCRIALGDLVADDGDHLLHAEAFYTVNELPR